MLSRTISKTNKHEEVGILIKANKYEFFQDLKIINQIIKYF